MEANAELNHLILELYYDDIIDENYVVVLLDGQRHRRFVDGAVRPICRPGKNQRVVYNGHKRIHAPKFQSVVIPNGLIANLYGPVKGRQHNSAFLAMSGLLPQLEQRSFGPGGGTLWLYGVPTYPHRVHLQRPYVSVEWLFGDIINYFKFTDFKKNLKTGLSSVGKMYSVCALLQIALTCLRSSNTAKYFKLHPPALNDYFS